MAVKNRQLIIVICAALVLCLVGALSPLIWLYVGRPQFDADDARMRIVFQVDLDAADDKDAVLESVRQTIERRLERSDVVLQFLVQASGENQIDVLTPEIEDRQIELIKQLATKPGTLEFALMANPDHAVETAAATTDGAAESPDGNWKWVRLEDDVDEIGSYGDVVSRRLDTTAEDSRQEYLVIFGSPQNRITNAHIVRAWETQDPAGNWSLAFQLNDDGSRLMRELTTAALPRPGAGFKSRLAIIMDGKIHSAPTINDTVAGRAQITGQFEQDEVWQLGVVLSAGSLPAPVEFVQSEAVGEGNE